MHRITGVQCYRIGKNNIRSSSQNYFYALIFFCIFRDAFFSDTQVTAPHDIGTMFHPPPPLSFSLCFSFSLSLSLLSSNFLAIKSRLDDVSWDVHSVRIKQLLLSVLVISFV